MGSKRSFEDLNQGNEEEEEDEEPLDLKSTEEDLALKKPKFAFNIAKKPEINPKTEVKPKKGSLRAAFNSDSEEEEEMPREAKMRMRNIGRDTPTSAGPNSFGKTKRGFCDAKKVIEKNLKGEKPKPAK